MHALTHGGEVPFILYGDFNEQPSQLAASGWLEALQATVVSPGEPTCSMGPWREIDFLVVTASLSGLIKATVDWEVPWGPHGAIRVQVQRETRAWSISRPLVPRDLPGPLQGPLPPNATRPSPEARWEAAWAKAGPAAMPFS